MHTAHDIADRLFGARHFDHYDFLFALTDRMGGIGLEHHRSSENATCPWASISFTAASMAAPRPEASWVWARATGSPNTSAVSWTAAGLCEPPPAMRSWETGEPFAKIRAALRRLSAWRPVTRR